jgi:BMFP domain-containing protein YqiC
MNSSGGFNNFRTKKNNGSDGSGDYSNQCLWIAILYFINVVLGNHFSLTQIREFASSNNVKINNPREEFRVDDHYGGLLNLAELFGLQIHFYLPIEDSTRQLVIPDRPDWKIVEPSARNVVSIVSYGAHFELITSINSIDIYGDEIEDSNTFKPDRELAVGKKIAYLQLDTSERNELNDKIDNLLRSSVNLSRFIINMEQRIQSLETIFERNQNNTSKEDFDTQTAIVASFQEHRATLQKVIDDLEKDLEGFKSLQKTVLDELLPYFG